MKRVEVEICSGTACFVMGGADLLLLEEYILEQWGRRGVTREVFRDRIALSGVSCSEECRDRNKRPPFVRFSGELVEQADIETLLDLLEPVFFDLLDTR